MERLDAKYGEVGRMRKTDVINIGDQLRDIALDLKDLAKKIETMWRSQAGSHGVGECD